MADADPATKAPHKTTRRRFLIGTGAAVGLVIGYAVWPRHPKLNLPIAKDEAMINGWLKVGTDGRVVVIIPQAEMGQGVLTSLPMIVAEELGVPWNVVAVEPAPLHPLYANFAMTEDAIAPLPHAIQGAMKWTLEQLIERFSVHITGGSTSVRSFHDTLRLAGATARDMLRKAAARQWNANWEQTTVADGKVHLGDKSLSYAELAAKAAHEDVPKNPKLKDRKDFTLIGTSVPRIDIPSKTDGSAIFGLDVRLPNMVYAALQHAPTGGGAVVNFNKEKAKEDKTLLGVVQGPDWVALVSDRWHAAHQALDKMQLKFAPGKSTEASSAKVEAALAAALDSSKGHQYENAGDVDVAFKNGKMIEASYHVPYLAHACMEPMNATAQFNDDESVDIWAPTQSITLVAMRVSAALNIAQDKVHVHPTLLGGGFGRKAEPDACVQAAWIAREIKRPVQLIWSREEDIRQDRFRPMAQAKLRGAVDKDGNITAFHFRASSQSAAGSFMGRNIPAIAMDEPDNSSVQGATKLPYDFGAHRIEHAVIRSPIPIGFWRSVGHSQNAFFIECFIDDLAHEAKADPLAFRLKHLTHAPRYAKVLQAAADKAGPKPAGLGRGYALHESFGSIVAEVADVQVSPKGELVIKRVTAAVDCGNVIHPDTVKGQIEGAIIYGLSAALHGAVTFANGVTDQSNFDSYPPLTLAETPEIDVVIVESGEALGGIGEVGLPPVAPAVVNAIFNATGVRVRSLPLDKQKLIPA